MKLGEQRQYVDFGEERNQSTTERLLKERSSKHPSKIVEVRETSNFEHDREEDKRNGPVENEPTKRKRKGKEIERKKRLSTMMSSGSRHQC